MNPRERNEIAAKGFKKKFAERLIEVRMKKKMSVNELAEASGVPFQTLHRWESGDRCPVNEQLLDIAEALGVKPGTLIPSR